MKNIILTGDRPTGRLHVGHFVGSLNQRVKMQDSVDYDEYIILIADAQALTDNYDNPEKVRYNIIEVMLDYLAVGIDPSKVTFALQSEIRALPELTQFYQNLVTLPRLLRNPTVKSEIKMRGFEEHGEGIPVGFANYPISQAADITAFKANLIPVGDDQLPMLEQTREIVRSFNRIYKKDVLVECKEIMPDNDNCKRLPGLDGQKMSKSLGNAIYLADEPEEIKKKVNSIVTFPRALEEPGILENNMLFVYLDAFAKDEHFKKYYEEFNNLDELRAAYQKGGIGDGRVKKFLFEVMNDTLTPFRERRKEIAKDIPKVIEILKQGTKHANELADETLKEVKQTMGIGYFYDDTFENEIIERYK